MIQNPSIENKLKSKTDNTPIIRSFLEALIEIEVKGKNYKKYYEAEIQKAIKKEEETKA